MKKPETILKEYVSRLPLDSLKALDMRFNQRIGSDLAEAIEMMSGSPDMDKWFSTAKSCSEFYDMVDSAQEYVERELTKRSPELVEV